MIDIRPVALCLVISMGALTGCSSQPTANPIAATHSAHATPAAQPGPSQSGSQSATGKVVETMDAANYTYVRVATETGEIWAAATQFKVAVGDRVVVPLEMPMENFRSQSLNREFPIIYFASSIRREGEQAQPSMPSGHPIAGSSPSGTEATKSTAAVEPAPGGSSVAKVCADRLALAGKTITVRGKVVKYNAGILNKNWLHIQDGSGTAADGTNDLTVSTKDTAALGAIVTATGTVTVDKDLGAGYVYKVILTDATLTTK